MRLRYRIRDVETGRTISEFFTARETLKYWRENYIVGTDRWIVQYFRYLTLSWENLPVENLEKWSARPRRRTR